MTANPSKRLATEREAAQYLGCAPTTLRQSRWSGVLFGNPAPKHLKLGSRSIRYDLTTLDKWLSSITQERAQ